MNRDGADDAVFFEDQVPAVPRFYSSILLEDGDKFAGLHAVSIAQKSYKNSDTT
jgi:hypothetical protein